MLVTITSLEQKYTTACFTGDLDTVKYMFEKETNKNILSSALLTVYLNKACEGGHLDTVILLLNYIKTDTNYYTNYYTDIMYSGNKYVLYYAFKSGSVDIINTVAQEISPKTEAYTVDKMWKSGMLGACKAGNFDIFIMYTEKVCWDDNFLNDCMLYACKSSNYEMVEYLLNKGAANFKKFDANKCLTNACKGGCTQIVNRMIELGANTWNMALYYACKGGHIHIIKLMLLKNIDIAKIGHLCLGVACEKNHIHVINLLLTMNLGSEIGPNFKWDCGLSGACVGGNIDIVKLMIQKGATSINYALQKACNYGNTDIVKFLSVNGASNIRPCLYNAYKFCGYQCLVHLVQLQTDLDKSTNNWNKLLFCACGLGGAEGLEAAKFIINCGSTYTNLKLTDAINNTSSTDTNMYNLLIRNGADITPNLTYAKDFRLYNMAHNKFCYCKKVSDCLNYLVRLKMYPPYILFVYSRNSTNKNCSVKKIPTELFRLLFEAM